MGSLGDGNSYRDHLEIIVPLSKSRSIVALIKAVTHREWKYLIMSYGMKSDDSLLPGRFLT